MRLYGDATGFRNRLHTCEAGHSLALTLFCLHNISGRRGLVVINVMRDNQKQGRNAKNNPTYKLYNSAENVCHNSAIES